ncbi:PrgI family mobile element protein [Collinsella sp. AM13-34]|uniref:PrgI family mobile element protein n=1 Tax=Collinsella sp. AM13-34 TaxID=2292024 RepID=UPI000E4E41FF|nr:PrgI family protein [Collinsella sp. AM13-34]RHI86336.1 hypothetical protein DW151_04070 [Collinsella sp. AM13-34]
MAETFVRDDINNYVARNIFGHFSKRSAVAALAAASVVSVGIYGVYAWDWNLEAVTYLAIPVCVAIGVIGLHSHHGLKSEKWLPLMLKDRAEPDQLMLAVPTFEVAVPKKTRAELRKEKRRKKAAKKARKVEQETVPAGIAQAMAEVSIDNDRRNPR